MAFLQTWLIIVRVGLFPLSTAWCERNSEKSHRYLRILQRRWLWRSMGCEGGVYGPGVPFCGDTTGLSSIAIWQRNVYLILFLIACLVANVVLWMRRKCFSCSRCAPYLETNRSFL